MIELTDEHLAARELRTAAYHEAAHKTAYERFGGAGDAIVWKNKSGNPEEVAWLGQFRPRTSPEVMRAIALTFGFTAPDPPANWKRLYGIAGLVAEEILSGETDDAGVIADAVHFRISNGEASDTDLAAMGMTDIDDYYLDDEVVEESVRILQEVWLDVKQQAEQLIEFAATDTSGTR